MKTLYKINKDHEVVEFIRQEILSRYDKDIVAITIPRIEDSAVCSADLYGFQFTVTNQSPTINLAVFYNAKGDETPTILSGNGYDYYTTAVSESIKLKTFLERNPQFADITQWTTPVIEEKKQLCYSGHNTRDRRFSVRGIEGVEYTVSFPEHVENDRGITDWSKPACEALTRMYYRDLSLDKAFNIKRGKLAYVEGIWFSYDYKDGLVQVYDASLHRTNIWSVLKLFDIKPDTLQKIKQQVEEADLEVKEITFIDKKNKTHFKYEELI